MKHLYIRVYERTDILAHDVNKFQADIVSQDTMASFDHHAVGRTPAEALMLASSHWYKNEV